MNLLLDMHLIGYQQNNMFDYSVKFDNHFLQGTKNIMIIGELFSLHAAKQVIATGFEMRRSKMWWGFRGLLPEEWIRL